MTQMQWKESFSAFTNSGRLEIFGWNSPRLSYLWDGRWVSGCLRDHLRYKATTIFRTQSYLSVRFRYSGEPMDQGGMYLRVQTRRCFSVHREAWIDRACGWGRYHSEAFLFRVKDVHTGSANTLEWGLVRRGVNETHTIVSDEPVLIFQCMCYG